MLPMAWQMRRVQAMPPRIQLLQHSIAVASPNCVVFVGGLKGIGALWMEKILLLLLLLLLLYHFVIDGWGLKKTSNKELLCQEEGHF